MDDNTKKPNESPKVLIRTMPGTEHFGAYIKSGIFDFVRGEI